MALRDLRTRSATTRRAMVAWVDDRPGFPPPRSVAARVVLGLAAVVAFGVTGAQLAGGRGGADEVVVALVAAAQVGAVAVALHRPRLGWLVSLVATALVPMLPSSGQYWWVGVPWPPLTVLLHLVALLLLAVAASWLARVAASVTTVAVTQIQLFQGVEVVGAEVVRFAVVLVVAVVVGLGAAVGAQRDVAGRLADARRGNAEEQARRAVLEERTRIAREMHDVVAHHLSAIAVRAESAPARVPGTAPPAAAELRTIAATARDALADMRRLLGVLREDSTVHPVAPAPDLDGIADLVAARRAVGVDVSLELLGERRPIPGAVALVGHRVVQEALSNATRHAGGAAVEVRLQWLPSALRLQVENGPGEPLVQDGPGHGLVGMRERIDAVGGMLVAGPRGDGGFTVDVTIPLP